jgi:tripartite-type tricarboxylate transporter receptor subunit TctC
MNGFSRVLFAAYAVFATTMAHAQPWPAKPVKLVVPFAAGGAVDATARLLAQELQGELGQPVVVENRTGAGGVIAVDQVAKSAPDGYTMALAASTNLTMAFISGKPIPYALNDLTYVAHVARSQLVFVARKDFPASTLQQVLEQAAARPGKISYGDLSLDGIGAVPLTYGYISRLKNVKFLRVPYRGEAPILTALLGGEIDLSMVTYTAALPHLQAGTIKAVAGGSRARFSTLPQLPTIAESTIPGYEAGSSFIVVGPAKLPSEVVARMNTAVNQVLARPSVQKRMADLGLVRTGGPVDVARDTIAAESKTWQCVIAVVKGAGAASTSCFQGSGQ